MPKEEQEDILIDEATLYKALKLCRGDRKSAKGFLARAGIELTDEEIDKEIEGSSILSALFGSDSPVVHTRTVDPEAALLRLPNGKGESTPLTDEDMGRIVEIQDEYIAARGLEGVGFSAEDIQEMESMAQFVGHGFKKTVDLTHGVMISQLWQLKKRLDKLNKMIDDEDADIDRIEFHSGKDSGGFVTHRSKRTEAERLALIQEQRALADLVQKYARTTNEGAAIRLKAEMASHEASERAQKRPTKRLKQTK
jgi:hypothetical protein